MDKGFISPTHSNRLLKRPWLSSLVLLCGAAILVAISTALYRPSPPTHASAILEQCSQLRSRPGVPSDFYKRKFSDRFEPGTKPVLITNATIWTGGRNGTEVVFGDMLMHGGIILAVGYIPTKLLNAQSPSSLTIINAQGSWVTPGLFDLHSHVGLLSAPVLTGAMDVNSPNGPIIPWLRSVDAINTRDDALKLTVAGGVTGGLILPGSGNGIGGQAFPVKYRRTPQRTPFSMLIEPPFSLNASHRHDPSQPLRWRHMKHATGENQIRFGTRMDSTWAFRSAYEKARQLKEAQDSFCAKVEQGRWDDPDVKGKKFPYDLQWEALVDVIRGRVKVNCHTYETEDIDFLSRLTNEFKFSLAAIHHAHEAYLVPGTLKQMWNGPPTVAIFAINSRYKRESYRGSEFAPRILADNGITVIMKSDHPVIDSRYLAFEAQQAHFYSLPANLALQSVTTAPARAAGLGHRIGSILEGYDADVVIWDSHPLALGATPQQVFIDGIPQIIDGYPLNNKPQAFQRAPPTPSWDREVNETLKWDGLPPLKSTKNVQDVVFLNVGAIYRRNGDQVEDYLKTMDLGKAVKTANVTVRNGRIQSSCAGTACASVDTNYWMDLQGGFISIGLTSVGSPLGLSEISSEPSASDGAHFDPLISPVPPVLGDPVGTIDAVDGLQFEGRDTLLAYRSGVTSAISTSSRSAGFIPSGSFSKGTSVAFRTGYSHALQKDAVIKAHAALHIGIGRNWARNSRGAGVSTQIAALRKLLEGKGEGKSADLFRSILKGELPLVIDVYSADIMASLIRLKSDVESRTGASLRMAFSGASEAHLLADEIAEADIGVILSPLHAFPGSWEGKRVLAGPPLTKHTAVTALLSKNVTVALGVAEKSFARNALLDVAWAALDARSGMREEDALALVTTNLYRIFDIDTGDVDMDEMVAYQGGDMFSLTSKPVAVLSPRRETVDIL